MADKKDIHITQRDDGKWQAKREKSDRTLNVSDKKRDAEEAGRNQAKKDNVELFIHGRDGKIQRRDSYGNDPYPPKG